MTARRKLTYIFIAVITLPVIRVFSETFGPEPLRLTGKTMGTTYHITYFDDKHTDLQASIDSLLAVVNKSINTYDPTSEVSQFNSGKAGIVFKLPYFYPPLKKSWDVYEASGGAFDPTVMPLVNAWGFGPAKPLDPTPHQIDSLLAFVGFNKIILDAASVKKLDPRAQLDFGGIGQGYGADIVSDFLRSKGIADFLVELGGEGVASGKNKKTNQLWQIGILDPNSTLENQFFKAYVSLSGKSFTTAGNYFNYREINGQKYSHTIDPKTGYPAERNILSASVFASDCMTADAWDTAFMVMGHEHAIRLLERHPELEALILYSAPDGKILSYVTPGIAPFIKIEP